MTHPTWEYHLEPIDVLTASRFNELGLAGWELVTTFDASGQAIFKRVGPDYRERITIAQREQLDASTNAGHGEGSGS